MVCEAQRLVNAFGAIQYEVPQFMTKSFFKYRASRVSLGKKREQQDKGRGFNK